MWNYGKLVSGKNDQEHAFPNHKHGMAKPFMGFTDICNGLIIKYKS